MALFVWNCLFCLLPSLCLFLSCLVLRWPTARRWTWQALRTEVKPRLICKPSALAKHLLRHCGSLARPRATTWPKGEPYLQTLSSLLFGQHEDTVQFTRDNLLLKDGGIVAVDWAVGTGLGDRVARKRWDGRKEHQPGGLGCFTSTPPVLLLIPQSLGGVTPHLQALCHQAMQQGFYVAVFHPRGTAGCPLTTARLTEFGDPADLEQAVDYVHSRHPSSALVAVSEGSGSGILLSYLGECGSSTYLTAAAAISPVLLGQVWFETSMPPVYRWGALFLRKLQLSRYGSSFRAVLDVDRALSSSSLRDFEESLFCSSAQLQKGTSKPQMKSGPNSGARCAGEAVPSVAWALGERANRAKDWDSYWERNEPLRDADEVAVPVLCICSRDDPLLPPASTLPVPLFQNNPYFFLVLTDKGGHCGFSLDDPEVMEGGKANDEEVDKGSWSHVAVLEFFRIVADFLKGEKDRASWGGPLGEFSQAGQRNRSGYMAPSRRRATVMRRPRLQATEQSNAEAEEGSFTWKRSYTR